MPRFKIEDLKDKTKGLHEAQKKWRKKNWENTLAYNGNEIEELLDLIDLFDIWSNKLQEGTATKSLLDEIYANSYYSIHFTCFGLYNPAYVTLRVQFETALRLIYFKDHPLEFQWWLNGDERWINKLLNGRDVWGNNFIYLEFVGKFADFDNICPQKLGKSQGYLSQLYSKLSKYVHSVGPHMQTSSGQLSPTYEKEKFDDWLQTFKDVQKYIHIIFSVCFHDVFTKIRNQKRDEIFTKAIGPDYTPKIKQILGI